MVPSIPEPSGFDRVKRIERRLADRGFHQSIRSQAFWKGASGTVVFTLADRPPMRLLFNLTPSVHGLPPPRQKQTNLPA